MTDATRYAWFDGEILPLDEIRVSPLSHSLHYGTGVFEGIRAYEQASGGGGVFRLKEHLSRMFDSSRILGYEIPYDLDQLVQASLETLAANNMTEGYLRPLVWLGEGALGLAGGDNPVHTFIAGWPWGAYLGEEGLEHGIRAMITSYERTAGNASAIRAKVTGQYVTSFMAKRMVLAMGLDEGLLLDRDGYLCEATGENLFMVRNGVLYTAPDDSAILQGITRDCILTLAKEEHIVINMERFTRTDLYSAEEAFLTGTAAEVTPIREVDTRPFEQCPGPVTLKLQHAYMDLVTGKHELSSYWITPIP